MNEAAQTLKRLLDEALASLARGDDAVDAERRAKAVSALVKAEREVAELMAAPAAPSVEDDEESRRAELRRRLARFVEADLAGAPPDVLERIALTGICSMTGGLGRETNRSRQRAIGARGCSWAGAAPARRALAPNGFQNLRAGARRGASR